MSHAVHDLRGAGPATFRIRSLPHAGPRAERTYWPTAVTSPSVLGARGYESRVNCGILGPDDPLPSADLRYSACAVARGYKVTVAYVTTSSPTDRTLDVVLAEWREWRADKIELSPESYLLLAKGLADGYVRDRAMECLTARGYIVVDTPRPRWAGLQAPAL